MARVDDALERRAGFWIRAGAAGIDAAVGFVACLLLSSTLGHFFAARAVVTLRIGAPDTLWKGPLPLMLGVVGEVVYLLPCALLLAWILDPLTGATAGKRLLGLRVRGACGRPVSRPRFWHRAALQTIGMWGWTLALLAGDWRIAVLATTACGIILLGSLAALGSDSLTLHDRLSATMVCRVRSETRR